MEAKNKKPWYKKPTSVAFAACCAIILALFVGNLMYHEPIDQEFLQEYEEFDSYEQVNEDPVLYKVSQDAQDVGYLVFESHYGYQSDVEIATLVGMDGAIIDTRTYAQDESPSYYKKLIGGSFFKKNFPGQDISEGFDINTNVDAISHATISSNAATKAVQKGVSYVGEHYLGVDVQQHEKDIQVGYLDVLVFLMLILAFATSRFTKIPWLKWVARVYSIVVMGFMAAQFITLSVMVALCSLEWPALVDYLRWYILVFGALILILGTGKNLYCNYICPFGALQEVEAALAGPLAKKPLHPKARKILQMAPGILVFVCLALALGTHNLGFANYEPFSLIFGQTGVGIQWALLPIVLLGALFSRRFYCNFACPVGFVLNKLVLGRNKLVRLVKGDKRKAGKAAAKVKANEAEQPVEAQAADVVKEVQATSEAKTADEAQPVDASQAAETPAAEAKPKPAKKGDKPMEGRDWLVTVLAVALILVSVLSICNGFTVA